MAYGLFVNGHGLSGVLETGPLLATASRSGKRTRQETPDMSIGAIAIDHVQIAVPRGREEECVAFYRDLLGASEIAKPAALQARGGAWFQLGNIQFHIGVDAEPSPPSRRHICFLVENLTGARAWAEAKGIAMQNEGEAEGLQRFFIHDPAGNRIEIGQR
jgi:catechol 2,3-dioxygenase-like lactoylglutathione lyase family enzyme